MFVDIQNSLIALYGAIEGDILTWSPLNTTEYRTIERTGETTRPTGIVVGVVNGGGTPVTASNMTTTTTFQVILSFKNKRVDIQPFVTYKPTIGELTTTKYRVTKYVVSYEAKDPVRESDNGTEITLNITTTIRS